MKNSSDTIGNRTRELPVCSAVPQPTAPPAACPMITGVEKKCLVLVFVTNCIILKYMSLFFVGIRAFVVVVEWTLLPTCLRQLAEF
jgi:hypothetical protein